MFCVAIDFGTSRSGIAFSAQAAPFDVYAQQQWPHAPATNVKTLSAILLESQPPHRVIAFGDHARHLYLESETQNDLYFEQFKMGIYTAQQQIQETYGARFLPTELVLSRALEFMKYTATKIITASSNAEPSFYFVITIPAIWPFAARTLVRKAAIDAGIPSADFTLALEPECAALAALNSNRQTKVFEKNFSYVVVDVGGGTADFVAHQLVDPLHLHVKELIPASGGPWGSRSVDREFEAFLNSLFGDMTDYIHENSADYLAIMQSWEVAKISFKQRSMSENFSNNQYFGILFPLSFWERFKNPQQGVDRFNDRLAQKMEMYKNPQQGVDRFNDRLAQKTPLKLHRGRLRVPDHVLETFYEPTISRIAEHLVTCFQNPGLDETSAVFLVGGMSSCSLLSSRIEETLLKRLQRKVRIIVPTQPDLAVVSGAAIYGASRSSTENLISERRFQYSLGLRVSVPFNHDKHPVSHLLLLDDGRRLCRNVFKVLLPVGTAYDEEFSVSRSVKSMVGSSTASLEIFYSSSDDVPSYTSEDSVQLLARLDVRTDPKERHTIDVSIKFSDLYLSFKAVDRRTGGVLEMSVDMP